jgi:hypothetical protein
MPAEDPDKDQPIEVIPVRQMRVLFTWKAPIRPFKRRSKEFWLTALAIILLTSLIFIFFKEWFFIATILAAAFVYYVLSTVPPEELEYRITTKGISFEKTNYDWDLLWRFWFSEKHNSRILNIDTRLTVPGRITFVVPREDEGTIRETLEKYLINEEAPPTFLEKAADWLTKKFPLEIETEEKIS